MAEMLPEVVAEIDALASEIANRISRLPADRLLHRGWWEFAFDPEPIGLTLRTMSVTRSSRAKSRGAHAGEAR